MKTSALSVNDGIARDSARMIFFGGIDKRLSVYTEHRRTLVEKFLPFIRSSPLRFFNSFPDNRVSSAHYNVWNFLPLQLIFQFSKLANAYFLLISILQQNREWTSTGQFTTAGPLFLFVALAVLREAYDDYKRHQHDASENNAMVDSFNVKFGMSKEEERQYMTGSALIQEHRTKALNFNGQVVEDNCTPVRWQDLTVGDIVRIQKNEAFPADLVLLSSSAEDGSCYVETSSLDGESTLKKKQAFTFTAKMKERELLRMRACILTERPNSNMYNFDGSIEVFNTVGKNGKIHPLSINNILLRGSVLKNTKYIYGVVVFSGEDTKIRQNATAKEATKAPVMERTTNSIVITVFLMILLLSVITTVSFQSWDNLKRKEHWYLQYRFDSTSAFFTFLVLFNTMIPISLYVTMEIIKLVQAWLITNDPAMFDEKSQTGALARTSSLNEDLGQVCYVFSDKTGTLTDNIMKFRKFSAGGLLYAHNIDTEKTHPVTGESSYSKTVKALHKFDSNTIPVTPLQKMVEAMALCHSVTPLKQASKADLLNPSKGLVLQSTSPDEESIVRAAYEMGFILAERTSQAIKILLESPIDDIDYPEGNEREYEILSYLEFTSDRKRMSIIVRSPEGLIILITKGADSELFNRLNPTNAQNHDMMRTTPEHVRQFAVDGLRVLAYGYKVLRKEEYDLFHEKYEEASTAIVGRQEKMEKIADEIEKNLELLGITAIEDQLQDGVPQALDSLREANIKLWVLTGDKRETALNIGYSSHLIKPNSIIRLIDWNQQGGYEGTRSYLKFSLAENERLKQEASMINPKVPGSSTPHIVVIFDGPSLTKIDEAEKAAMEASFSGKETKESILSLFLELAMNSDAVICCRFSPMQKRLMVEWVKRKLGKNAVTLAIGDGANDVAMLREAHVGIGITGREGLQAARASDYSIPKFKHLVRLLLLHGRWSYVRNAKFIMGSFYKCIAFYFTQVFFQGWTGTSGTSLFESWTLAMYNILFSSIPVIMIGIFEKDLTEEILLSAPSLYQIGQKNEQFNVRILIGWLLAALYHALCLLLIPIAMFGLNGDLSSDYADSSLIYIGTTIYLAVVVVVNLKIAYVESMYITRVNQAVVLATIGLWFLFQLVYSRIWNGTSEDLGYISYGLITAFTRYSGPIFVAIVTVIAALMPDIAFHVVKRIYSPTCVELYREKEKEDPKFFQNKSVA
ncbi:hypothetical protein MP638_003897 [Amoeboaphelidium occidentale]|nr:hypothetical protein MP638_003897 [Amoeboaphelidium occidentale]